MTSEAETEVMRPLAKAQKLKVTRNEASTSLQRETIPDLDLGSGKLILDFGLQNYERIYYFFLILGHPVCNHLLKWSQETHTAILLFTFKDSNTLSVQKSFSWFLILLLWILKT